MYNRFQLLSKYLQYWFTASNGKGHGVHSPFAFNFIKDVLRNNKKDDSWQQIEFIRKELIQNKSSILVEDLGAGSGLIDSKQRIVADMAGSSLKPAKYSQLLFRIVKYYQPSVIIELGTSFGITTCYLAAANPNARVYTIEGSSSIAEIANKNFQKAGLKNIELMTGNFDEILPRLLKAAGKADLAFIDGNHREEPTWKYFNQISNGLNEKGMMIFDDIHWSKGMESAWKAICMDESVRTSIDLFFLGIISMDPAFKNKQDFRIRF